MYSSDPRATGSKISPVSCGLTLGPQFLPDHPLQGFCHIHACRYTSPLDC